MTLYAPPRPVASWGRVSRPEHAVATPRFMDSIGRALAARGGDTVLAVGLGRSYGDSNLNSRGRLIDMSGLDRVIAFDAGAGVLHAEAGLSLGEALKITAPKGWFLTTVPGTRFVTLGGAVAHDVHGKNHHRAGGVGCAVRRLGLLRSDGSHRELSRADDGDGLFQATIGGMGLTGVITWVELDLSPVPVAALDVERIPFGGVRDFFRLATESVRDFEHTVAWIDCANGGRRLGRGIFQRANWSSAGCSTLPDDRTIYLPFEAPKILFNRSTMRLFNRLYYRIHRTGSAQRRVHYAPFFFPLDAIAGWNRLYGNRGFYQYQCVVPPPSAEAAIEELIREMAKAGGGSFLAVLKTLGPRRSPGLMSFPREGATLAVDFPNKGAETAALLARLDAVVAGAGGRLYAAKDGRMPADMFRRGYPEYEGFVRHLDPAFSSDFWRRVSG